MRPQLVLWMLLLGTGPAAAGITQRTCGADIVSYVFAEARFDGNAPWVRDDRDFSLGFAPPDCTVNASKTIAAEATSSNGEVTVTAGASSDSVSGIAPDIDPDTGALRSIGLAASFSTHVSAPEYQEGRRVSGAVASGSGDATVALRVEGTDVPYDLTVGGPSLAGSARGWVRLSGAPSGGSQTVLFETGTLDDGSTVHRGSTTGTLPPGFWALTILTGTYRDLGVAGSGSVSARLTVEPPEEVRWREPVSGTFAEKTRWDPERVPGAADPIRFDLVGSYTVDLDGGRSVARMTLHTSDLTLTNGALGLAGGGPALAVGLGAKLALPGASLSATDAVIGDTFAPRAIVRVAGGGRFSTTGQLAIGGAGPGTLEVLDGSVAAGDTLIGGAEGPPEVVAIAARGARDAEPSKAGGFLHVHASPSGTGVVDLARAIFGGGGFGSAVVDAGGLVRTSGDTVIGVTPGPGTVLVTGDPESTDPRSVWESGGTLVVGDDAPGLLDILGRGRVTAPDVRVGARTGGEGTVGVFQTSPNLSERSELAVTDTMIVGDAGTGTVTLATFGSLTAKHLKLGLALGGEGTVTVSEWAHVAVAEKIQVGGLGSGELEVGPAGEVSAKVLEVPADNTGPGGSALVTVAGKGAQLRAQDQISVGSDAPGVLRIAAGGDATTAQLIVFDGEASVEGSGPDGPLFDPSTLSANVTVVGKEGGSADLLVADRAKLACPFLTIASNAPADPAVPNEARSVLTVRDATVRAGGVQIGTRGSTEFPPRPGTLALENGGLVEVTGTLRCEPRCTILGDGRIDLGSTVIDPQGGTLTNLGTISAGHSPGTIQVGGSLVQESSGRLVMEVGGLGAGQMDVLDVAGNATLGGTLELRFVDGFAPRAGNVLPILPIGGKVKGAFAAVHIVGLEPGFDFALGAASGALAVTALTDGAPKVCAAPADGDQDGVTDCADNCPHAANAPATLGTAQADSDADGIGDACDPCVGGVPVEKPALIVQKGMLTFKGKLRRPDATPLVPSATGVRLLLEDGAGRIVLDATAPAGAFDKATKRGWKKLKFKGSAADALTGVSLGQSAKKPEAIAFKLAAPVAGLDVTKMAPPLRATLVLDAPVAETGLCGEMRFAGPPGVNPLCRTNAKGKTTCGAVKRK